jgi:hypothetical protein
MVFGVSVQTVVEMYLVQVAEAGEFHNGQPNPWRIGKTGSSVDGESDASDHVE